MSDASTISQVGLEASLNHCMQPAVLKGVHSYYAERTAIVADGLNALGAKFGLGRVAEAPKATFYVWANFSRVARVATDLDLFRGLLDLGVAVVPGSAFSMAPEDKWLRLSCAIEEMEQLRWALGRFDMALTKWCTG